MRKGKTISQQKKGKKKVGNLKVSLKASFSVTFFHSFRVWTSRTRSWFSFFPVQKVHKINLLKSKPRLSAGNKKIKIKKIKTLKVVNQQKASSAPENRHNKSIPVCSLVEAKCFLQWHVVEANCKPKNTNLSLQYLLCKNPARKTMSWLHRPLKKQPRKHPHTECSSPGIKTTCAVSKNKGLVMNKLIFTDEQMCLLCACKSSTVRQCSATVIYGWSDGLAAAASSLLLSTSCSMGLSSSSCWLV